MKDTKHTPGPWAYKRTHEMSSDHWYVIVDKNGRGPVVDVGGKDESGQIAEAKYLVTDQKEIEANARLIAAAPELLEALKEIEIIAEGGLYTPRECMNLIHELAKLATDKAKGL